MAPIVGCHVIADGAREGVPLSGTTRRRVATCFSAYHAQLRSWRGGQRDIQRHRGSAAWPKCRRGDRAPFAFARTSARNHRNFPGQEEIARRPCPCEPEPVRSRHSPKASSKTKSRSAPLIFLKLVQRVQITKLKKLVKRQMYRRGELDLLKPASLARHEGLVIKMRQRQNCTPNHKDQINDFAEALRMLAALGRGCLLSRTAADAARASASPHELR